MVSAELEFSPAFVLDSSLLTAASLIRLSVLFICSFIFEFDIQFVSEKSCDQRVGCNIAPNY